MDTILEAIRRRQYGKAHRHLKQHLKQQPGDGAAWFWLGAISTSAEERAAAWHTAERQRFPVAEQAARLEIAALPVPLEPERAWGWLGFAALISALLLGSVYLTVRAQQAPPPLAVVQTASIAEQRTPIETRELVIEHQYVAQYGDEALAAVVVRNPHSEIVANVHYTATIQVANTAIVRHGTLDILLPGQSSAFVVGGRLPAGTSAEALQVELAPGEVLETLATWTLPDSEELSLDTDYYNYLYVQSEAGGINNPYLAVLEFDDQHHLINAGMATVNGTLGRTYDPVAVPLGLGRWPDLDRQIDVYVAPSFYSDEELSDIYHDPQRSPEWLGQKMPYESRLHVDYGETVDYASVPPTSGQHWGTTTEYGFYDEPVENEILVHNLEHGAVIINYDPTLSDYELAQIQWLTYELFLASDRIIAVPYEGLDGAVVMTTWNYRLDLDEFDPDAIRTFYMEHYGRGPECNAARRCP